ncbi:MAG: hypothetical protein RIS94_1879 [Pseudomonadota bacterium]|jgi:AcrR family transcriptional regulator
MMPETIRVRGRNGQGRERLLAAAATLFGERGFEAVSTKELALAAEVTIGSLYHHFASKEAIYQAALMEALDALPAAPIEAVARLQPREAMELQVAWFSEAVLREPLVRQELLSPHLDQPLAELPFFRDSLAQFRRLVPIGAPGVDPQLAIGAIISLCFGMTSLKGLGGLYAPPADTAALARLIVKLVLDGPEQIHHLHNIR